MKKQWYLLSQDKINNLGLSEKQLEARSLALAKIIAENEHPGDSAKYAYFSAWESSGKLTDYFNPDTI